MASKDSKKLRYLEKEISKHNTKKSMFDSRLEELEHRKADLENLLGKISRVDKEPIGEDFIQQCQTVKGQLEALVITLDQVIKEYQSVPKVVTKESVAAAPTAPTTTTENSSGIDMNAIMQMLEKPEVRQIAEAVRASLNKS